MRFEFATTSQIIFGPGTVKEIGDLASNMGTRVFLITGKSADRAASLIDLLEQRGVKITHFSISNS